MEVFITLKTTGIIVEYNPLHPGHIYHMEQTRKQTGADYLIAVMSGSFVQRGEPAIFDKYLRTKTALLAGADLVLEIPVAFSTASAHEFAAYGVALLSAIGVDAVVFGSECGQIEILKQAAYALNYESAEFQERLRKGLKAGLTYPQARAKALEMEDTWASVLSSPNNILGIEYLRAAEDLHSLMEFYTISRKGSGYHEDTLADANFPSASAIRGIIRNSLSKDKDLLDILASHLPAVTHPAYTGAVPVFVDDFSELLNAAILQMQATFSIADLSPELAARLAKPPYFPLSFEKRIQALKTRQLTYTRVSRALLHLALGMREEDISRWKDEGYALYARILGFRRQSSPLLSCLHKKSSIPLITKMADASQSLAPSALALLEQEVYASHLYQTVRMKRSGVFQNEYTEGLVFV